MKIYKIQPVGFASNSYIITADDKTAVIIDCAQPRVIDECERLNLQPKCVLLTHGHYDHIGGCGKAYEKGADIYCGVGEDKLIFSNANRAIFHDVEIPYFELKDTLTDGQILQLCDLKIAVIATPGHTAGGVSYVIQDCLFTGDTLFYESIGRTDFETGNYQDICKSIKNLYSLKGNYKIYCGHGEESSLEHERLFNPYVKN